MKLTTKQVKKAIQHTLPVNMRYTQAMPLRDENKRPTVRAMGVSTDKLFSVELIGNPKSLSRLVFMSLYEPNVLGRNLKAMVAVLKEAITEFSDKWLLETMPILEPEKEVKNGRLRLHLVPLEDGVSVVFLGVE